MAFCSKCGKELPEGVRFCLECGAPVENKDDAQDAAQTIDGAQTESTAETTQNTAVFTPPAYTPPPPVYNQPYQQNVQPEYKEPSIGSWLGTFFLLMIPGVNLVMLIVWACGVSKHKCKANFARARLIFAAIWIAISLILCIALSSLIIGWISRFSNDFSQYFDGNTFSYSTHFGDYSSSDSYEDFHDFMDSFGDNN